MHSNRMHYTNMNELICNVRMTYSSLHYVTYDIMISKLCVLFLNCCVVLTANYESQYVDSMTLNVAVDGLFVKDGVDKIGIVVLNFVRKNPQIWHIIALQEIRKVNAENIRLLLTQSTRRKWSLVHHATNALLTDGEARGLSLFIPSISPNVGSFLSFNGNKDTILVWNVHLNSSNYGPYLLCDGKDMVHVMKSEYDIRVKEVIEIINHATFYRVLEHNSNPIVLLGDFNSPSHLDSESRLDIEENERCKLRKHFTWPVTTNLMKFGFVDAYRTVVPVTENAGNTWSPIIKHSYSYTYEPQDRIDMIYYRNPKTFDHRSPSKLCTSRKPTVETGQTFRQNNLLQNGAGVDWTPNEWPSDHSAVILQLNLNC